ncbi:MAG: C40 family peptidase [Actinomycetota bacterium]|nr:C40 family peptidase [Actinomycetota bacterium]
MLTQSFLLLGAGLPLRISTKILSTFALAALIVLASGSLGSPASAHTPGDATSARAHVVRRALDQLGTKYVWGAESPKKGFDCSGLTMWAYSGHGASLPHQSLMQYQLGTKSGYKRIKSRKDLIKGDIVAFKTSSAKVGHVGLYIGEGKFVSAVPSSGGVSIDSVNDPYYWGDRWVGATRVRL